MTLKIKKNIEVKRKDITYREVIRLYRSGKWKSCPELIQRLIDIHAWTIKTINKFFQKSQCFTGGADLQNIITTSRQNLIDELKNGSIQTLDDDAELEIEKTIELLNKPEYKDVSNFIIDCQSRLIQGWDKFFQDDPKKKDIAHKYEGDITFIDKNNNEDTISDFYFMDLTSEQQQSFLDQKIQHACVEKGSITDIANLVVELNSGSPWTTANMTWIEWLSATKFKVSKEIIENLKLKKIMATIKSSSQKYDWNKGGYINLIFQNFYIVKHFDSKHKRYMPTPEILRKWVNNKTDYITFLALDETDYKVSKKIFQLLSFLLMLPNSQRFENYKSILNLFIFFNLLINKKSDTGRELLQDIFGKEIKNKFIIIPSEQSIQKRFIELVFENEIKLLKTDVLHKNGEANLKSYNYVTQKSSREFKDIHLQIVSKNFKTFVKKLRNEGLIKIVEKPAYKDSLQIALNSEGMENSFNQEIPLSSLMDSKQYENGHLISNYDEGSNDIENFQKEQVGVNRSHGSKSI
jgi:hypothetical protein|tara:strand:+ start:2102 stop:3664 length:1563 start_codon:yes stop_codon:yes gene_type:complete